MSENTCTNCGGKHILPGQRICEPCKTEARGGNFQEELAAEAKRILTEAGFVS